VKAALSNADLRRDVALSSANSISLGRLLPQMAYYAQASLLHWREHGRALSFVVPTGNLGNALACLLVRRVGLPVAQVSLATNANPTLAEFFAGGDYRARPGLATLANAMDVGAPSNFERLQWLYPEPGRLRQELQAQAVSDAEIQATLTQAWNTLGEAFCPHTATAACLLRRQRQRGVDTDACLVATAHPAKFPEVVEPCIGAAVPLPPALARMLARPSQARSLPAEEAAFEAALRGR
jgi:threonine synthase